MNAGDWRLLISPAGNVGIGTLNPQYKLDVEGYVQAFGFVTGDLVFRKGNTALWRMYEDADGLYLESLVTGKHFRLVMQETSGR